MGRIVYLLGAGASFGERGPGGVKSYDLVKRQGSQNLEFLGKTCPDIVSGLPVISELPQRIDYVVSRVWTELNSIRDGDMSRLAFGHLAENLEWMQQASSKHATIDTFAKKLWVTHKEDDYYRLKHSMSVYFMLEQMLGKPDPRYDAFFAAILGNAIDDLPNDVSIVSWNYDCQIELAFADYLGQRDLNAIHRHLNISAKNLMDRTNVDCKFNILKLNGTALLYDTDNQSLLDPFYQRGYKTELGYMATLPYGKPNIRNLLSFAWEGPDDTFEARMRYCMADAEVLVVIGYSFPFFNRMVDKRIFMCMPKLRKVYIQDLNPDNIQESVMNLLEKTHRVQIEKRDNLNQFFLPPEL